MAGAEFYLVPGFMGFETVNQLDYFVDVEPILKTTWNRLHREIRPEQDPPPLRVHAVSTIPAASVRKRAQFLAEAVATEHDTRCTSVHFLGHSTGGLDVRVLLAPNSRVPALSQLPGPDRARLDHALACSWTGLGLATPHRGTPVANLALQLQGEILLSVLGEVGRIPLLSTALRPAFRIVQRVLSLPTLHKHPFAAFARDAMIAGGPEDITRWLVEMGAGQGALNNLTPESADTLDAVLVDPPQLEWYDMVTLAPNRDHPTEAAARGLTLDPKTALYRIAWHYNNQHVIPLPDQVEALVRHVTARSSEDTRVGGSVHVAPGSSDGVVPSASQVHGEILGVVRSDHLDCVGHYPHVANGGVEYPGWVSSGASFDGDRMRWLWGRIGETIWARHEATTQAQEAMRREQ